MSSILLEIRDLTIQFPHKVCVQNASGTIHAGDKIALIGDNGTGKSTFLQALCQRAAIPIGYLPQDITLDETLTVWQVATKQVQQELDQVARLAHLENDCGAYQVLLDKLLAVDGFTAEMRVEKWLTKFHLVDDKKRLVKTLSGGERVRLYLASVLAANPELLLFDEPTNHLDQEHRNWLFAFLSEWKKTALIISHDLDFIRKWPTQIWQIKDCCLKTFTGSYDDLIKEQQIQKEKEENRRHHLKKEESKAAYLIDQEQTRRARGKAKTNKRYENDPFTRKGRKMSAENSMGSSTKLRLHENKQKTREEITSLNRCQKVKPRFHCLKSCQKGVFLSVEEGALFYGKTCIASHINLFLEPGDRVAIKGANGSGKTTLFRALLSDPSVTKEGKWVLPIHKKEQIGYLDQHYHILLRNETVKQVVDIVRPDWSEEEKKRHLKAFLFYHHSTHDQLVETLSEGEKARLALAKLAASAPQLLILDEVTNNLDITTKEHLIEVLNAFEGTLIINCHEEEFLQKLNICQELKL